MQGMKFETDEELKMDMKADIETFLNRKKDLANMLNFSLSYKAATNKEQILSPNYMMVFPVTAEPTVQP